MEKYNPDKTSIEVELVEIWDFFGITEEDILNHSQTKPKTKSKGYIKAKNASKQLRKYAI